MKAIVANDTRGGGPYHGVNPGEVLDPVDAEPLKTPDYLSYSRWSGSTNDICSVLLVHLLIVPNIA